MDIQERETPWLKRVEELIQVLEGSTVGELELTEAGTQIIIRRRPDMMMVSMPTERVQVGADPSPAQPATQRRAAKEDRTIPVVSPLTGVFYAAPSPSSPPFVTSGGMISVGQTVALIEAMKVFNEIQSEVSGRVVEIVAVNGEVVQKGDALIKVEPL
jgi:acetyl-CoA carboxylase biotin carboxyl carrier protein